jgi:hypothetical protein
MTTDRIVIGHIAETLADQLALPHDVRRLELRQGWHPQSLAYGAAGIALLHIERARAGAGSWQRVHDWLTVAATERVVSGEGSHLHYGAPAVAYALHAAADRSGRYAKALETLDRAVAVTTARRLEVAHARMDVGVTRPALAEFDSIRGLSGIGAHLLRRESHGDLLRGLLTYVVRLTEPVRDDGESLPGWWSAQAPSGKASPDYPGGHANNGMAHGIAGPLALLSLALRRGVQVPGQRTAIERILSWFDRWRQGSSAGFWWPHLITRAHYRGERRLAATPSRPSWCYGTAGIARAQQLAALALGDAVRARDAERALAAALTDYRQLGLAGGHGLCHGHTGMAHIAARAAADAPGSELADLAPGLLARPGTDPETAAHELLATGSGDVGLLEGAVGVALALHTASLGEAAPASGWDAFLLVN